MKKKIFALLTAIVMLVSLAGCSNGGEEPDEKTPASVTETPVVTPEITEAPKIEPVADVREASIDFEDGVTDFLGVYLKHATSDECVIGTTSFNGSTAIQITTTNPSKYPWFAIDVYSLLGEKAADVATVEMQVGTLGSDGQFYSASGEYYMWADGAITGGTVGTWSVYLKNKNPKYAAVDIAGSGYTFSADNGVLIMNMRTETAMDVKEGGNGEPAVLYIDNLRFLDASGNLIKPAATQVAFTAPAGFENTEADRSNLVNLAAVEFAGFATSAAGWAQNGFDMPAEIIEALVPGSYIEVEYASADNKLWCVMPGAAAGWMRCGCGDDFSCADIYYNDSHTTLQIPFEVIAAACGENVADWGTTMQFEGSSDWEVYSVKVGSPAAETVWSGIEFAGFAKSAAGWAQDGLEMPEEIVAALVPGSYVKAEFSSEDGKLWMVMPWATIGWSRCGCGDDFACTDILYQDGAAYIPYEAIAAVCGDNVADWGTMMQFEGSSNWEVYSVEVGKFEAQAGGTFVKDIEFAGFAKSAAGWAQDGLEMPEEIAAALVPGSVIKADFSSEDGKLWVVMPWATAGWMRCGCGDDFSCADITFADGAAYIPYEVIAAVCGDNVADWGTMLQFESSSNWEVYSVEIGHYVEVPRLRDVTEFEGFATSAGGWAQNGFEMPENIVAKLVPGSVIKVNFTSADGKLWAVMPGATAGWMRCGCGDDFACSDIIFNGNSAYITYETIAALCGDNVADWGTMLQFEGSSDWEVYSVSIGQQ